MDDIYLFGNNEQIIYDDFNLIQQLLGLKGLNINLSKTNTKIPNQVEDEINPIKLSLLQIRRHVIEISGEEIDFDQPEELNLNKNQEEYLLSLLKDPNIEEDDAELILVLLKDHSENVLENLANILEKFPHLIKNIYHFSQFIEDKNELCLLLIQILKKSQDITEYQLFWIACIVESYLLECSQVYEVINLLITNPKRTSITKSKILEMKENRFGLPEIRESYLRSGQSDWLSWSSAIGTLSLRKISRNHLLTYFANGSQLNSLIADYVKNID
jgi:hypothetical protein